MEAYYPVDDAANNLLYLRYKHLADHEKEVVVVGRLAEYKYFDMDDTIKEALELAEQECNSINI